MFNKLIKVFSFIFEKINLIDWFKDNITRKNFIILYLYKIKKLGLEDVLRFNA